MKAIIHTKYGSPDELQLKEVEKPVPGDIEVLIKIHATTVTTSDCNVRNFTFVPKSFMLFARLMFGLKKPKINILGIDLAGEIEAVGKDVKLFKEGDHVFGSPGTKMDCQHSGIKMELKNRKNIGCEDSLTVKLNTGLNREN